MDNQELTLEDKFHSAKKSGANTTNIKLNRRWAFAIALILTFMCLFSFPLIGIPALIVVILYAFFTLKDPKCPINILGELDDDDDDDSDMNERLLDYFSLMRVNTKPGAGNNTQLYDKFIDVLIKGGIIDNNTDLNDIALKVVCSNPPTYELELNQIGKTERQLVDACERALLAYSAYLVDVEEIGGTNYRITYKLESDIDILAGKGIITYDTLLDGVNAEGTQIDLKYLPAGVYADGSPAYVNLAAGNSLCQGEPGSGKSVYLSALSASILRAVPQIQFAILSPKSLDFQNFMDVVPVIQDTEEQLAYLRWAEEQGELRKQVCLDRHIKKIDKDLWDEYPPIVIMIDEYATVRNKKVLDPSTGRQKALGAEIDQAVNHIVAELRFAAISVILTTQRFSTDCIDSTLRANISGTISSFATNSALTDSMVWGDSSELAPCYKIKKTQTGCGYIAVGGATPRAFKGAFCDDRTGKEELEAVEFFKQKRDELEGKGRKPFPKFTYVKDEPEEEEAPKKKTTRRNARRKTA